MKSITITLGDSGKLDVTCDGVNSHLETIIMLQTSLQIVQQDMVKKSNLVMPVSKMPNLKVVS